MNNPQEYTELIVLTLAGSRDAYSELYEITIQDVYKTVHFLIGDPSDVDDVVQEIYIQVHRSLGQFDVSRPFRPWLMGLVMRQIQAFRRKRWTHLRITKKAENYEQTMAYDFSNEVVDKLSNRSLLASVEHLPYKLKQVVILHYLSEYSHVLLIPTGAYATYNYLADSIYDSQENVSHIGGTQQKYDELEAKLQEAKQILSEEDFTAFMPLLKELGEYNLKFSDS